ncbi:hypothetical protein BM528_15855 [Alteromonas sp. RW2A1]|uniref:oligosaccharide flippase family protein n=1 Tax=Alteromonas sp. RW2A1 TaxID=1917158 RepID=UPI0009040850|nr:oligosaccharide flippase family protein [Alteromonas sp. RW2A1]APE07067.1 hypothetical protein BM528_15855 [Alteromonas sp. RW2A1]
MNLIKNLGWSATNSLFTSVIILLQLSVTTKYLDASDFAVFAVVTIFVGFCLQLAEGGVGNAIITFADMSKDDLKQVMSLALLIAIFLMFFLVIASFPIASFYDNDDLVPLLIVVSLSIPFFTIARCYKSILQTALNMKSVALVDITARSVSFIFVVTLAINGYGVWSLAIGTLVLSISLFIGYISISTPVAFVFPNFSNKKLKKITNFSFVQSIDLLITYFTRNLDVLILVKLVGDDISGAYSVIKTFLMQIVDTIFLTLNRFYYPYLVKSLNDVQTLRRKYIQFYGLFNFLNVFTLLIFVFYYEIIITTLFRKDFIELVPILLITVWLLIRYTCASLSTLWLIRAKPHIGIIWNLMNMAGVLIVLFFLDSEINDIIVGFIFISIFMALVSCVVTGSLLLIDGIKGYFQVALPIIFQILVIYFFYIALKAY